MTAADMAVRENFHDATFCLVPASLDESLPTAARVGELGPQPGRRETTCGKRGTTDLTPITDATTRPAAGEATRPPSIRDEKEKTSTGNLPRQRHKTFRQSGSLSQQTHTPRAAPHVSSHFGFPVPCRAPLGVGRRKSKRQSQAEATEQPSPGLANGDRSRPHLPKPFWAREDEALTGLGFLGLDLPRLLNSGLLFSRPSTASFSFRFVFLDRPKSFPARLQNGRTCPRIRGAGRSREKRRGNWSAPQLPSSHRPFFPLPREQFRRHRRRQRRSLEARFGDEMTTFQTHPISSMDSSIQQPGSRPSREEPIQRSSRLGPNSILRGTATRTLWSLDTIAAFDGRDGRATLSHKIKKTTKLIDPIPSSRGPLCTQRSRPGPDRPGYRGTAPPFRRTPPPSGPRIGGARRSAGNLFPGRICRWLRWPAGWTGLSRREREKRRSTTRTGWRLQSCSTGKHRLVSDHTAATTQEPRTRQSGDGEGDGMNLSDEALV